MRSTRFVKSSFFLPLILILIIIGGCQTTPEIEQDALDILQQTKDQYTSIEDFRLDAKITTELEGGGRQQTIDIPLTYAISKPGMLRLEVRHDRAPITMVSNDSVTWTYNPSTNQYSRTEASTIQRDSEGGNSLNATDQQFLQLAQSLINPYTNITNKLVSAKILRSDTLLLQGKPVAVSVVETVYKDEKQRMHPDATVSPTLYWISEKSHLVLKQVDTYTLPARNSEDSVRVSETTVINDFTINPSFSASTFTFEAPESASRVSEISIGGNSGSTMEGRQAPEFTLTNLEGEKVSLEEYRGKIVLLDFWATWCAPCRRAHPDIQELYEEYSDDGLAVLGINNEGRQTARQYMQQNSYTFTTLLDTTDSIAREYGVNAMPYYFVIDRDGKVVSEIMGYRPKSDMLQALQKAGLNTE